MIVTDNKTQSLVAGSAASAVASRNPAPDAARPAGRRGSLGDEAYRIIKKRVLSNELPGGFQVLEDDLARDLNMSRTPVREALVRLDNEGLIELIPRHGMRVTPISLRDVREAYQLLGFLETAAAEMIAQRDPKQSEVAALRSEVAAMSEGLSAEDIEAWAEADERFHRLLVSLSGNSRLARIANTLLDQTERFRRFTMRLRKSPIQFVSTHAELVDLISQGNIPGIRRVHLDHKNRWLDEMAELVEKFQIHQV